MPSRSLLGSVLTDGLGRPYPVEPGKLALAGCHAKLERAREHLKQLDTELGLFFDSNPYRVVGKVEPNSDRYIFRIKVVRQPPPRLGVLIGEFVHQLRSSLDHMVWEAATKHLGRKPPENISLPIETSPKKYRTQAKRKLWNSRRDEWVFSDRCLALIEGMQPYQGSDAPDKDHLATIERIWNLDKHQVVAPLPVTKRLGMGNSVWTPNDDAAPILDRRSGLDVALKDNAEIAWSESRPLDQIRMWTWIARWWSR